MFNAFDHDKNILGVIEAKDFYYAEDEAIKRYKKNYYCLMKKL